jgi:hypothetical protein
MNYPDSAVEKTIKELTEIKELHLRLTSQMLADTEDPMLRDETRQKLDYYHHQSTVINSQLSSAISRITDIVDTKSDRYE